MTFRCLLLLLITMSARSQDIDSLLLNVRRAQQRHDPQINLYLDQLAKAHLSASRFDSAVRWYRELVRVNKRQGIDSLTAISMNDLGVAFYKLEEFDSCIFYYSRALDIYSKINDPLKRATIELNLSIIYKDRGQYERALDYALQSASKLEKMKQQLVLGSCYNNLGLIYTKLENYPYALAFHRKALQVRRTLNNQKGVGQSYNNIAMVFRELQLYDSALQYYTSSLIIKRLMNDSGGMASSLGNIGDVLMALNKPVEAERYYKESLALKVASNDRLGESLTLNSMTRIELIRKNFKAAEEYLDRAEQISLSLGFLEGLKDSYGLRMSLYKTTGDFEKALQYSGKLIAVKDSLMSNEKVQSLAEMQTRYEAEKKENRIVSLEQEKALHESKLRENQLWISSLVTAATLLAVIAVLVLYLYRATRRNKRHVEMLLKELHHRVKNNLQIISSVLSLQSQRLTDQEAIQAVKASESRVNAMALIHRKLYAGDQNRSINMEDYTTELLSFLQQTYGFDNPEFELQLELKTILLDVDKAIAVGLILNELISNSFKHAYQDQRSPWLSVSMDITQQKTLTIDIADNGKGISGEWVDLEQSSFGLKMVRMLVNDLHGTITINTKVGTGYALIIPMA